MADQRPTDQPDRLSPLTGEFAEPEVEHQFRLGQSPEAFHQARIIFALGASVSALFLFAGLGFSPQNIAEVLPARGGAIIVSLICLSLALRMISNRLLVPLLLGWQAAITLTSSALIVVNQQTALATMFVLPAIFYLAIPNSFRVSVVAGSLSSMVLFTAHANVATDGLEAAKLAFILLAVNVMLAVLKSRSGCALRRQWAMSLRYHLALEKLDESKALIERTFDAVPIPLLVTFVDTGVISRANPAAERFLDVADGELIGRHASEFHVDPGHRTAFANALSEQGDVHAFRAALLTAGKETKTVLLSASSVSTSAGPCMVASVFDVTEQEEQARRLNSAENEYRALFENAEVGIYRSTPDGQMLRANPALARLNGYETETALVSAVGDIASEWYVETGRRDVWLEMMRENGRVTDFVSEVYRHKSRERIWVSENAWTLYDDAGEQAYFEGTIVEATDRKRAEAEVEHMAQHDALTDLPNRRLLTERLEHAFAQAAQENHSFAVLCLDLDRFKAVNDAFGHVAGDLLLKEAARRLQSICRQQDTVARLGGDEFTILASHPVDPDSVATLASRIISAFADPFALDGHLALVGTSIGIAIAPADGSDAANLIKSADRALYQAKREGKNTYRFVDQNLNLTQQDIRSGNQAVGR